MDPQLSHKKSTSSPLRLLPIFGKSSLKSPQIMVFVDIVFLFLIGLKVLSLSVSRMNRNALETGYGQKYIRE